MAKRFVRSVIRVFVVFNVEMSPAQGKKRALQSATQPLQRCKRAFQVGLYLIQCGPDIRSAFCPKKIDHISI